MILKQQEKTELVASNADAEEMGDEEFKHINR